MDHPGTWLTPLATPGIITTLYAYEGGAARNALLAALALHLAGVDGAEPVLIVDWDLAAPVDRDAMDDACPALYHRFGAQLTGYFRHVPIASGGGRSAAVDVCTRLLPDRLVGPFTPAPGSTLCRAAGRVARARPFSRGNR